MDSILVDHLNTACKVVGFWYQIDVASRLTAKFDPECMQIATWWLLDTSIRPPSIIWAYAKEAGQQKSQGTLSFQLFQGLIHYRGTPGLTSWLLRTWSDWWLGSIVALSWLAMHLGMLFLVDNSMACLFLYRFNWYKSGCTPYSLFDGCGF